MRQTVVLLTVFLMLTSASTPAPAALDADAIGNAAGAAATTPPAGLMRTRCSRDAGAVLFRPVRQSVPRYENEHIPYP